MKTYPCNCCKQDKPKAAFRMRTWSQPRGTCRECEGKLAWQNELKRRGAA